MSVVYVTSDWHIGHTGISENFRKQFPTDDVHDQHIIYTMRSIVKKRDIMYVIGDVTWTTSGLQKIKDAEFPCKMVMVGGNHDTLPVQDYLEVFDEVVGVKRLSKGIFLTHIPIHRQELRYGDMKNVHGHCHRGGPWEQNKEPEYFNAILEYNDYLPVSVQEVHAIMKERKETCND